MIKYLLVFISLFLFSFSSFADQLDQISTDINKDISKELSDNKETINDDLELNDAKENLNLEEKPRSVASEEDDISNSLEDDEFADSNVDDDIENSLEDDELRPRSKTRAGTNKLKHVYRGKISPYTKGDKLIDHPNASKGLYKITKDLDYLYKVENSEQKNSASVRFGMFDPTNLATEDGQFLLSDLYEDSNAPMILIDYEWQYKFLGKFSLKAGSGFYYAQGNGRFNSSKARPGDVPLEDFSLVMFPNSLNAVYKLQFWDEQFLVPYAEAGVDAFAFMEFQDGEGFPRLGGSLGGHIAFGGTLSLNFLDQWSILNLDRDYGINAVSIIGEFRNYFHIAGTYDFSGTIINGGIALDF